MTKLTDESVAKALVKATGMKLVRAYQCVRDLTTITAEIEARGLGMELATALIGGYYAKVGSAEDAEHKKHHAETGALALCAALLAFLKESKNA